MGFGVTGTVARKIRGVHFTIIATLYGMVGSLVLIIFLTIQYFVTDHGKHKTMRIFTYDRELYWYALAAAVLNVVLGQALTLAQQSYKLSFVMIFQYENLVYSLLADFFIFHTSLNP